MPKFRVIIYRETYSEYITEAENKEKAKEKCRNLTEKGINARNVNTKLNSLGMINIPYGGIDLDKYKELSNRLNYIELYDLDDLDNLFENQGLFSNKKIGQLVQTVLKYKYNQDEYHQNLLD